MNSLLLGAFDKTEAIRERVQRPYMILDDGPMIEALSPKGAVHVHPERDGFDVLEGMNYQRARDFVDIINVAFPEGESTLTRKNASFELLRALCDKPTSLLTLLPESEDAGVKDARQKIETLLLSPVLRGFFTRPPTFSMQGTICVHLDRRKLRDFDAFVLGHLMLMRYRGQVVIPDFGFYGRPYLSYLIREERLICGVRSLSELSPELQQEVLLMDDKEGQYCTRKDAEELVSYEGISRKARRYDERLDELIS